MVQSLATTVTEMAEGEVAQLERAGNPDATVEDYFRVIDRKTASLIAWCARVGGSVGAGAGRAARALRARAGTRVPDRRRRARQRHRRGDRRQVGRARPAGGQADAAGAAGLRGRPGARAARPRAARRAGRAGRRWPPRSSPTCAPRAASSGRAQQGGARWPTRRSRALEAAARLAATATALRALAHLSGGQELLMSHAPAATPATATRAGAARGPRRRRPRALGRSGDVRALPRAARRAAAHHARGRSGTWRSARSRSG